MRCGESSRILLSRRGMSPLIATVLLMAFAVALGGMIMNWSIDSGNGSDDCGKISVSIMSLCSHDTGKIAISMRNGRESPTLRAINLNIMDVIDSTIHLKGPFAPGQPINQMVPIAGGITPTTKIEIVGVVGQEVNPITCTKPIKAAVTIPACPKAEGSPAQ